MSQLGRRADDRAAGLRGPRRRRRALVAAVVVAWALWLCAGLGAIAVVELTSSVWCEHPEGESNHGDLSWSVVPPGVVCTWTEERHGIDDRQGPGPFGTIWVLGLLAGPALLVRRSSGGARGGRSPRRAPAG